MQGVRRVLPFAYSAAMRLRRWRGHEENKALAPFHSRIIFQHMPRTGRDGYLFHRDHDAMDQLSAAIMLRRREIDIWIAALRSRLDWCDRHQAAVRFLIIPEKHVVYEDKLPRFSRVSPRRPAMQLLGALQGSLREKVLYPLEALQAAGRTRPTYFKTDTHWNAHGAYVAYRELVASLRHEIELETVVEEDLQWKERRFVGDLGVRYARERGETRAALVPNPNHKLAFQNNNFGRGAIHVYENERRDLPTCVMFRDSFSNYLIPYLMHGFSNLVAVSSLSCHYDLLDQLKPDVVLFVSIERFLATFGRGETIELPEDAQRQSFQAFTGTPLDDVAPGLVVFRSSLDALGPGRLPQLVFSTDEEETPAEVVSPRHVQA